ncbi:amino acid ABC transporter permease [Acidipropionibacterium acidipropionici]|jgi:glutamate transport system permease protein|uniref:Amino acid ABC transporter permease n=1 Tax=Acidipropionibacterium acidipropionici TaxID=1748 RepID=A0A142KDS4_9ACTN|nr:MULTISPECIES: amino acid ABC transporter permease [Acidipropionibacterium]ALN16190.1 amino acid ABC transporter permease [Acidipropionibacterium acidipropionici]AMS04262.1 amino acid ABC transporter permease [Acidipropionibacterium acidipropionici]AOZ45754.1 amino acid ABC transporter permease [Acidipropionibacterium acidipropionici]APZ08060.1 amino acid ABC transporter permease [Acidipropionibacterium acidipropionici]AZP38239.1 amino acid ABC transporter permease [Acidipropionibacterium ac
MNFAVVGQYWGLIAQGIGITVALGVLGFLGAMVLGTLMAVFRISPIPPLRILGAIYVEVFRNIPLLSLLILIVFGLPDAGVSLSLFWSAVAAIVLASGAFVCETVRSGINAVGFGQIEASRAIGMSFGQVLRHVVLPQALATMVQPLTNVFIGTVLGSSLAAAVGVAELTNVTQQINLLTAEAVVTFLLAGLVYLAVCLLIGAGGGWLDRRLRLVTGTAS